MSKEDLRVCPQSEGDTATHPPQVGEVAPGDAGLLCLLHLTESVLHREPLEGVSDGDLLDIGQSVLSSAVQPGGGCKYTNNGEQYNNSSSNEQFRPSSPRYTLAPPLSSNFTKFLTASYNLVNM